MQIEVKYTCETIIINKHFGNSKKALQTIIAVNDLYDTRLCGSNSLVSYSLFSAMLVWSVF